MPAWFLSLIISVAQPIITPLLVGLANKVGALITAHMAVMATEEKSAAQAKTNGGTAMTSDEKLAHATAIVTASVPDVRPTDVNTAIHAALAGTSGLGATGVNVVSPVGTAS